MAGCRLTRACSRRAGWARGAARAARSSSAIRKRRFVCAPAPWPTADAHVVRQTRGDIVNARAQLALGWYQVVGGLAGLLSAGLFAAKGIASMGQALVLVAVAAFFLALGAAGALLLRGHGWAKPLSIAVQALQIP